MLQEPYAATVIKAVLRARRTVEAGVTTARDLGGRDYAELSVRDAVRAGTIPGPRMLCAGRGICITGGHGWHIIGRESDGPDEVRKGVREQLKAGADVVKLFATGGVMTPGVDPNAAQLTLDEVRAAIEEARKAGRRTAAADGITNLSRGRDHHHRARRLPDPRALPADGARRRGAGADADRARSDRQRRRGGRHPRVCRAQVAGRARPPRRGLPDGHAPGRADRRRHGCRHAPECPRLDGAGAGADGEGGDGPLAAIHAATGTAARVLGLERETGRVATGLAADLLAVAGNPAERIAALDEVRLVMARGRVIVNRR
jgi:hypothetical protein